MQPGIENVSSLVFGTCFYGMIGIFVLWIVLFIKSHMRIKDLRKGCTETVAGIPFFGISLGFARHNIDIYYSTLMSNIRKLPTTSIQKFKVGFQQFAILSSPKSVEVLLSSKDHIKKGRMYKLLYPWLGDGLLLSKGSKWFSRRKILTPAFHFKILDAFISVFNEQSEVLIANLQKEFGTDNFDIVSYISPCTLDVICETTMGVKLHTQLNRDSEYFRAINRATEIFIYRSIRPWLYSEWIFGFTGMGKEHKQLLSVLHNFTDKVIKRRREELNQQQKPKMKPKNNEKDDIYFGERRNRLAFLDLLIQTAEENGNLSDKDIREEVDTFMFEGHDTTAMAISWCLYLLAASPKHQKGVHEELDSIFGEDDRHVTMDDFSKMAYLEMCIKETLRLYPSVPIILRQIDKKVTILNSTFQKGTTFMVIPLNLHRLPETFPNPEIFNPENFLPERTEKRHPFAYIPFSAGSRNCIGQRFAMMEQKVVLSTVFRHFELEAVDNRDEIVVLADVVLRPKNGIRIRIKARRR